MTTFQMTDTVGDIVTRDPGLARVFEKLRIDYCCGGQRSLEEACAEAGADPQEVLRRLDQEAARGAGSSEPNVAEMSLTGLIGHIESTHHELLRRELPRLRQLTAKVAGVHGEKDGRLAEVRDVLHVLADELESHMGKEERILFPMIRELDRTDGPVAFHCGSLANPIRQMEVEHDGAGDALARLRSLTDDFTVPEWGCTTYLTTLAGLEELEGDLHRHVHKENNVLFPRAIAEEARRGAVSTAESACG